MSSFQREARQQVERGWRRRRRWRARSCGGQGGLCDGGHGRGAPCRRLQCRRCCSAGGEPRSASTPTSPACSTWEEPKGPSVAGGDGDDGDGSSRGARQGSRDALATGLLGRRVGPGVPAERQGAVAGRRLRPSRGAAARRCAAQRAARGGDPARRAPVLAAGRGGRPPPASRRHVTQASGARAAAGARAWRPAGWGEGQGGG